MYILCHSCYYACLSTLIYIKKCSTSAILNFSRLLSVYHKNFHSSTYIYKINIDYTILNPSFYWNWICADNLCAKLNALNWIGCVIIIVGNASNVRNLYHSTRDRTRFFALDVIRVSNLGRQNMILCMRRYTCTNPHETEKKRFFGLDVIRVPNKGRQNEIHSLWR